MTDRIGDEQYHDGNGGRGPTGSRGFAGPAHDHDVHARAQQLVDETEE
jgi:hypothetical protein